jgi:microcompartment protein CcmK/EutM
MILGKVVGTVVSSIREDRLDGARYLLVEKSDQHGTCKGEYLVTLDIIGANQGELVMISESTSARETPLTVNKPIDALIVGIIDIIDENEKIVYKK